MRGMTKFFMVTRVPGLGFNHAMPLNMQAKWQEHRDFIIELEAKGLVRLAGPLLGSSEILIILAADNEEQADNHLSADPWTRLDVLRTTRIAEWDIRHGEIK
jgi:uncharacterized protein YciI